MKTDMMDAVHGINTVEKLDTKKQWSNLVLNG